MKHETLREVSHLDFRLLQQQHVHQLSPGAVIIPVEKEWVDIRYGLVSPEGGKPKASRANKGYDHQDEVTILLETDTMPVAP